MSLRWIQKKKRTKNLTAQSLSGEVLVVIPLTEESCAPFDRFPPQKNSKETTQKM